MDTTTVYSLMQASAGTREGLWEVGPACFGGAVLRKEGNGCPDRAMRVCGDGAGKRRCGCEATGLVSRVPLARREGA